MAQKDDIARNAAKIAAAVGITWIAYKIVSGFSKNQTSSEIVKETVEPISNAASEVKKITRKFLKGSPEAKEYMRKLRSMPRKSKAAAGKKGGEATADLGKHKGHKSKAGLAQDQKMKSKESHEKHYRRTKDQKGFDQRYK
jgi:hypothetical protein